MTVIRQTDHSRTTNVTKVTNVAKNVAVIAATIDQELDSPADRMMIKLFFESYELDEIARFAGLPSHSVKDAIERGGARLEQRLGLDLKTLRKLCIEF